MGGTIFDTKEFQASNKLFPNVDDPYKTPEIQGLLNRGVAEGQRAKQSAIEALSKKGFGRSSFGEQIGTQVESMARQPYEQQALSSANAIRQQGIDNLMRALGLAEGYRQTLGNEGFRERSFLEQLKQQEFQNQMAREQFDYAKWLKQQELDSERRKQDSGNIFSFLGQLSPIASILNPAVGAVMGFLGGQSSSEKEAMKKAQGDAGRASQSMGY